MLQDLPGHEDEDIVDAAFDALALAGAAHEQDEQDELGERDDQESAS